MVPAWAILLIAGGLLERDGAFIIAGHGATLVTVGFFGAIAVFGVEGVQYAWNWLRSAINGS